MLHAWHDVSPGNELPRDFQAVIEIPLGSNVKYELDKTTPECKQVQVEDIRPAYAAANVIEKALARYQKEREHLRAKDGH